MKTVKRLIEVIHKFKFLDKRYNYQYIIFLNTVKQKNNYTNFIRFRLLRIHKELANHIFKGNFI